MRYNYKDDVVHQVYYTVVICNIPARTVLKKHTYKAPLKCNLTVYTNHKPITF